MPQKKSKSIQNSLFDLSGKVALVTGAGRGIGRAIALGFARNGADIAAISRNEKEIKEVERNVRKMGRRAVGLVCDVSDPSAVSNAVATIVDRLKTIDILVNNAGITKRNPTLEYKHQDFDEVVKINLAGTFYCCQAVGRIMVRKKQGNIINISALSGLMGMGRGNAVYSSTKGAMFAMTRELACEWGPYGIRVNAIAPYWFRSSMIGPLLENEPLMARILSSIPSGRIGELDDIVGSAVFLASAASSLITGQVLVIDGGVSTTFMPPKECIPKIPEE
jgi:NAD(P)-dependent dehydrogenase (short-subunit alcohol dehydrogenase family)